jgi:hypothetical protein
MKLFECQACGQLLYFENDRCERCGRVLGFLPEDALLSALEQEGRETWRPLAFPDRPAARLCANAARGACNWLVSGSDENYCTACRLNRTVPDLDVPENLLRWQKLEIAKRRLVYALLRLGLQVVSKADDIERGLAFDFLSEDGALPGTAQSVMTGHAQGLVTINIAEADDATRERMRGEMGEPYRALLGHFRHEVGHYYWERLVRGGSWLERCRAIFGDEQEDYGAALQRYYENGPPEDWQQNYVSAYASAHPWEDFAESWAHYLHIIDTLETAEAFGLQVAPRSGRGPGLVSAITVDPYRYRDFDALIALWLPLTYAVNSLNRSMGQSDLYPFVLAPAVIEKLRYIHGLVQSR